MRNKFLIHPVWVGLLALCLIVPVSAAQFAPAVFAINQDVVDGTVSVTRVTSNVPGWVVIHADNEGLPGPVLGQSAVPAGITADVVVEIDLDGLTDTLWTMLHVDEGTAGEYEFPGADGPVTVNDTVVVYPFAVGDVAQSIAGVAASTDGFSTLVQAVEAADLLDTLREDGPFTVFAPTDEAFAALDPATSDALFADPEQLAQLLLYHVIPGTVMAADLTDGTEVETLQGDTISVTVGDDGTAMVNGIPVALADVTAYNGVIHVLGDVLSPAADEEAADEEAASEEAADEEAADEEAVSEEADSEEAASEEAADEEAASEEAADEEAADEEAADEEAASEEATDEEAASEEAADEEAADEEAASEEATDEEAADEEAASEEATDEEAADAETAADEVIVPVVVASAQESDGSTVTVDSVVAEQDGWIVIHADNGGAPGAVLGQSQVPTGGSTAVEVALNETQTGETTLWAMLHVDQGERGTYEFPGPDGPVLVGDEIVMTPFILTATAMAEESATEETSEEAMAEESAADDAAEDAESTEMGDETAAAETMTMGPALTVTDQESNGANVTVAEATAEDAGWMVIHIDDNGAPGAVLGQASLPAGTTANIVVALNEPLTETTQLWAMLHADEGEIGVYEFPGPDVPVTNNNEIVMAAFTATIGAADTDMADDAMADDEMADDEMADDAMADDEMADDAMADDEMADDEMADNDMADEMADDEMADDMAAPTMLPQTGFSLTSGTAQVPVVLTLIALLFGSAILARRREQ